MFRTPLSRVSLIALTAVLGAAPQAVFAQDAETAAAQDETYGNQIVVTAQKREEAIKDVPMTVSALSGEGLRALGVDEFDEVAAYIPGLIVQEQSPNNPGFVIRGITSDDGSAQIAPRVTIYYNGVDVSRSRGSYFDLFDMERIEVVKGPQATLFGTASTVGAISAVTAKPQPGFDRANKIAFGNLGYVETDGMLNLGNETIAARLAFTTKRRDGYVPNIAGEPGTASAAIVGIDQDDLNGVDQYGIRGSVRLTPNPTTTIDLVVTYEEQNNPGAAFISGTIPPTGSTTVDLFGPVELGGAPNATNSLGARELGLDRHVLDVNLTSEFELSDAFTLTNITGYREFNSLEVFDADGTALYWLEFAEEAVGDQFSHETRLSYDSDMFRGFVGVNYFREDGTQSVPFSTDEGTYLTCLTPGVCTGPDAVATASAGTAFLTGGALSVLPYNSLFVNGGENSSFSVFADGTVVLGQLELTAGIRYITEDRTSTFFSDQPISELGGFPLLFVPGTNGETLEESDNFKAWLPRFNALFRVNDAVNVYGTISKGRRSPVLELDQSGLTLIEEEEVWNYEGGIKLATGGFNATFGMFYQQYTNFQVSLENEDTGLPESFNAGSADNFGVEVEAGYAFNRNIRVFANYAYIDAEIGEPADADATDAFVGSKFRLQPDHAASGGIDAAFPVGNGSIEVFATPTVTYQSRVFFDQPNDPLISQDGYTLVNVRAGVRFNNGRFEVAGFARNLLDEEYLIDGGNTGAIFGTPTFIPGEPAIYGIELSASL